MKKKEALQNDVAPLEVDTLKQARILQKVEEMGVFLDHQGASPMAGRVFAYLLLCEPPHKDFFEIQDALQASKSAISNALTHLQKENTVEYVTFTGDRRRYFRVNPKGWMENLKAKVRGGTVMRSMIAGVIAERADSKYPAMTQEIIRLADFFKAIGEGIEKAIAEWEQKNTGSNPITGK